MQQSRKSLGGSKARGLDPLIPNIFIPSGSDAPEARIKVAGAENERQLTHIVVAC
jgi:hypothetical protein